MSSKKLSTEEKLNEINKYLSDCNLEIDIIYYQIWKDKCVLSSPLHIPEDIMVNDLKAMGITTDEYMGYSKDQKIDISTKIYIQHMKTEYDLISTFSNTTSDITAPYQIRYHTGKVGVDKVHDIMPKSKKNK